MSIENLIQQMLILLILMAVGFIAGKAGVIDADGNKKITKMVLYVTSPAMILASAMNSELSFTVTDVLLMFLYAFLMFAVMEVISLVVTRFFRVEAARKNVYKFMMVFGNTMFMGFPVVSALYGSGAVLIASIFGIPNNFLLYSVGILTISGGRGGKMDWKKLINPAFVATIVSLFFVFSGIRVPYVIHKSCDMLGSVTVVCAMLVIGVSLSQARFGALVRDAHMLIVCAVKLFLAPAAVWAVCRFLIRDEMILGILVALAAMPVGSVASMFSLEYGGDAECGSCGVFLTTVLSVATVPLMLYILL